MDNPEKTEGAIKNGQSRPEKTEGAIKNGQSRETRNTKHTIICAGHHYTQANTNNVNRT